MAGSYKHITAGDGNLRDNESFVEMIENLGDAYEATEELYGMVWWLAERVEGPDTKEIVEDARQHYRDGLDYARRVNSGGEPEAA